MFERVPYSNLNARQQENYNFQKVAAKLADYGYNCIRLSDDWQGADFIACHVDGETILRIQLKGRLTIDKKYVGKNIYIAFISDDVCFVYPHDEFLETVIAEDRIGSEASYWQDREIRHWKSPPAWALEALARYQI